MKREEGREKSEGSRSGSLHSPFSPLFPKPVWKKLGSCFLPATKQDLDEMEKRITMEIDDLIVQVKANTDAEKSAIVVLKDLHDRLIAAGTDPAKLKAIRDDLAASQTDLAAAIVANTPAA